MTCSLLIKQYLRRAIWVAFAFILGSCAVHPASAIEQHTQPERVYYSFEFSVRDMQDVEIIDYWLKTDRPDYTFKNPESYKKQGKCKQISSDNGLYAKPTILYIKWRLKSTGQEYQDTVDVRQRLPKDMAGSTFTFLIKGSQLNVYLATRELRPADWPIQGPSVHRINKVLLLYPDAAASPSTPQ